MYTLMVHEGQDQSESGAFFRGRPFEVVVGERSVLCVFRKGTAGKVVYAVEASGALLVELVHPYYAPDFLPEELSRFGADASFFEAVYAALIRLGVTKDKTWVQAFQDKSFSFEVRQA
jgi:hypothetical protein